MFEKIILDEHGLHAHSLQRASVGAGSDTCFLHCGEGDFVLKFPAGSEINHPEAEPELCSFLRAHGIPACDFIINKNGSYLSEHGGRTFTLQRRFQGLTPEWNSASETLLTESAELLGKIHSVLLEYPPLPEGIGAKFFAAMTPERALTSYRRSLNTALKTGDGEASADLMWRIDFIENFPPWQFDLEKLTLRNTHGDYFISQFICENGHLSSVIDWTTACVHPVIWEIMRSFVYGAPCCADGEIDRGLLKRYIGAYCMYGTLNGYDRENIYKLYLYQIAVCDYYGQYYASHSKNRNIYLKQAQFATKLLKNAANILK